MIDLSTIYNLVAFGGIGMEIWGFWWLLKYGRIPKIEEYKSWHKKYLQKFPHFKPTIENSIEYNVEDLSNSGLPHSINEVVPIDFKNFWENRKAFSIRLVIIGLCGQIVQVMGNIIIENTPSNVVSANQTLGFLFFLAIR